MAKKSRESEVEVPATVEEEKFDFDKFYNEELVPLAAKRMKGSLNSENEKIAFEASKEVLGGKLEEKRQPMSGSQTLNVFNFDPKYVEQHLGTVKKVLDGLETVDEQGVGED